MTAFFLNLVERVSYAVAKGMMKAFLEWYNQPRTATDEETTNEDKFNEDNLRDYLAAHTRSMSAEGDNHSGPDETSPNEPVA